MSELAIAAAQFSILRDSRSRTKLTVVERLDKDWGHFDASLLSESVSQSFENPRNPRHLIIYGHHTTEDIVRVIPDARIRTEHVVGLDSPVLPFTPDIE